MTLPTQFADYTKALMGEERYRQFLSGMDEPAPVSIRMNPFKRGSSDYAFRGDYADAIMRGLDDGRVGWCPWGYYLKERPDFTLDPLLHAGVYYVQEAASMFLARVMEQYVTVPSIMLDLCAAPGGKSTLARTALPAGSVLFSNEPVGKRANILAENIQKFGHPDVIVTNNYPRDYKRSKLMFDIVLTDVPCSGEGMFRKDEGAIDEWSPANVNNCRHLQREIVSDIWPKLRPGGLLIYSTCTFNAHEDEENVEWIADELGADIMPVDISADWNITGALTGHAAMYRFIPGISRGEGLFMAVLRKHGDSPNLLDADDSDGNDSGRRQRRHKNNDMAIPEELLFLESKGFSVMAVGERLRAVPRRWTKLYDEAHRSLRILSAGIEAGQMRGRSFIPSQALALSMELQRGVYPEVEVSLDDARRFLRREAVMLPQDTPRGLVLISYMGHTIGFEKNLGNRANNLYPQEWKIRKQI